MFSKRILPSILITVFLGLSLSSMPSAASYIEQADINKELLIPDDSQSTSSQLGSEIRISDPTDPESERHLPSVAYNTQHNEYLVVWHNEWPSGHRDIYARRVSASGKLLSWFSVSSGTNSRLQPDVVYNAAEDEYLVVWMYDVNGDGSVYDIWGRVVAWNGAYQKPQFQIITWPNRSFWTPKAAWNSTRNEYMVVWNAVDATTSIPTDISHTILSPTGSKLYAAGIASADQPHQVDISFNAAKNEYLVVWRRMQAPADGDIMAARIGGFSGQILNPPGVITVSNTAQDQRRPVVTTNKHNRYLVVWEHVFPGPCCDWDIKRRELDNNGNLLGSETLIAATMEDETYPAVEARAGTGWEYLVTYQRTDLAGEVIWAVYNRELGISAFEVAAAAFWDHEVPAIAMGKVSALIVYTGDSAGDPNIHQHIYGRWWVPNSIYLPLTRK